MRRTIFGLAGEHTVWYNHNVTKYDIWVYFCMCLTNFSPSNKWNHHKHKPINYYIAQIIGMKAKRIKNERKSCLFMITNRINKYVYNTFIPMKKKNSMRDTTETLSIFLVSITKLSYINSNWNWNSSRNGKNQQNNFYWMWLSRIPYTLHCFQYGTAFCCCWLRAKERWRAREKDRITLVFQKNL